MHVVQKFSHYFCAMYALAWSTNISKTQEEKIMDYDKHIKKLWVRCDPMLDFTPLSSLCV